MPVTLVHQFDVTIPAGTPIGAPVSVLTQFPPAVVERIDWLFPAGCSGMVGIQIGARNAPVLPHTGGQFFTRNGDSSGAAVSDYPTSGDWSVIGYNTGTFPHTVHVTFTVHRHVKAPNPDVLIVEAQSLVGLHEYIE